ncbi:hypothetical protein CCACVL1_12940 [Corchorus capsularis]|uniref:BHLH domain-containing protein n=1 Tax=Corchorus capsularis TaxID=210143 RepID=A0A1R3ID83_COCAP|nr:hypothetical protein CCACVL1_12940 [Corchorus capsularis]
MADEFNTGTNWWDSSRSSTNNNSSRFDATGSSSSSSLGNFGWAATEMDLKAAGAAARSSMDSVSSVSGSSVIQTGPDLHMMGLGLSSQPMDWNQAALLRGDKSDQTSFRSMLQDNLNSNANYQQESGHMGSSNQWRISDNQASVNDHQFKQISSSRGFSLDHHQSQFSPHGSSSDSTVTCQGLPSSNFQMDSTALYGTPSTILQGILGSDHNQNQQQQSQQSSINYYGMNSNEMLPSWSKVPQFLRSSPPKQQQQQQQQLHGQLHFSNNAPFWNPSAASMATDNISEVRDSSTVGKKSGNEPASKRPRNETPSPLPAFKVRKEKMGDRITALQQLVSPFGKTDTASVLSEAIEYIKYLHEQVGVLSTPYMKTGAANAIQHQQNSEKPKDSEGPKQDLRSRGLCLVPVSSTFPVTHESTVDFWAPTFGGTFR